MTPKKTQNNTNEASMLLKTHGKFGKRTQKRTEKRTQIECEMRALNAQFELFDAAYVPAGDWNGGMQQGSKLTGWGSARKYKNGGNEAKKYLKTNDVTFLDAANWAHFTRKFAQIEGCREQKPRVLRKTKLRLRSGQARKERDKMSAIWPADLTASVPTAAGLTSLITTSKRLGLDPFAYLPDIFERIGAHPQSRLAELLPDQWKTARRPTPTS